MKLLIVSDVEDPGLWDHFSPDKVRGIDAVLSCGDLKPDYLEFLVTMVNRPLFYILGNHDLQYDRFPPGGCECIDDKLIVFKGYRILGLGGCMRYHPGPLQYTEEQMRRRVRRLSRSLRREKGFDILLTHAPAAGLGDMEDLCHWGFQVFRELIDQYQPLCHLHGHVHLTYNRKLPRVEQYGGTSVVNAEGKYVLELPDR